MVTQEGGDGCTRCGGTGCESLIGNSPRSPPYSKGQAATELPPRHLLVVICFFDYLKMSSMADDSLP
jgi:hypothetical protein